MGGLGEDLHLGVRRPPLEVGQEALVEHGVAAAPRQQHRPAEGPEGVGHTLERGPRGVVGADGDVGDELGHRVAAGPAAVGRPQRGAVPAARHLRGALDEHGGLLAHDPHGRAGGGDQRRHLDAVGQGDGGVGEHEGPAVEAGGGADGDRAAPVVGGHHDRPGGVGLAERHQLVDALGQHAGRAPVGEAHAALVDGDDPPALRGEGEELVPDVRPGGVAVGAHERAVHGLGAVVEDVPRHTPAVGRLELHEPRPRRVEPPLLQLPDAGPPGRRVHQISSASEQLRPEPMPHSRMRSPAFS